MCRQVFPACKAKIKLMKRTLFLFVALLALPAIAVEPYALIGTPPHADDEQRSVREGWRLMPNTAASPNYCAVTAGQVSARSLGGGVLQFCAPWSASGPAQAVEFVPTPPDDTGIVSWPPYRLRHGAGEFAPPSPGEGAEFIEAFRALELTAVCRQPGGGHALLVEQRCEGTGCPALMRVLEQGPQGWGERWLGDRGWQPLASLLRCKAGETPLDTAAPFRPCACAGDEAQSPSARLGAFEQALRALGAARALPVADHDPLELWLHAEGPEIAPLTAQWQALWQGAGVAPLERLESLDAGGYRLQRLRFEQGWESAEWVHLHHARSGLRAWFKAPLIDSRRGETVFSSETAWRFTAPGVLRADLGPAAGGGTVEWTIGGAMSRWALRRVPD